MSYRQFPAEFAEIQVESLLLEDPRLEPLLAGLQAEYTQRYGDLNGSVGREMNRFPAEEFAQPQGRFIILSHNGQTVAGGAFRRYDSSTAEFKRIWTHDDFRRRGLARRVLDELERGAQEQGYSRVFLTTGPRQPEARELYLRAGYTAHFDLSADPETLEYLAFSKPLGPVARR